MKEYLKGFYYSFPVQLVLLHFKKYQVLLLFWIILVSAVNGDFMSTFGADSLFLAPEYLGDVNALSAAIVGIATGVYIMSWHITTFILHSKQFKFLATTSKPFLKYFINNSVIPILFLVFYFIKAVQFDRFRELLSVGEILILFAGFLSGFLMLTIISLVYFFGAERTMMRKMEPVFSNPQRYLGLLGLGGRHFHEKGLIHVEWFFNTRLKLKKPREISHYTQDFIETIFKRHHFSAVISIILAFLFLAMLGLFLDNEVFKLPAAASFLLFFSILIAASGALAYWLKSWSVPVFILMLIVFDLLFRTDWIDPRNKAYGLNYNNIAERPAYNRDSILRLCTPEKMYADAQNMMTILENWKRKQIDEKPPLYIINVSGGGTRSATFTVNVLQRLDSLMHYQLMRRTFLITGASGGMLGASYFRELYRLKQEGRNIHLQDKKYVDNISKDMLNALFSSLVARDIFAPAQKFSVGPYKYVKDRAYAFEQELNNNTQGILDRQLKDYIAEEKAAEIPLLIYGATVSGDGRKMMISTQPISFMMRNWPDSASGMFGEPDAIDFCAFFQRQDPYNLRMLSAMRLNATFPYVLPNVWLPTSPIIDVMDAGIRDNYGQENTLRFLNSFRDWIEKNTGGVVFIQIRDRKNADWDDHFQKSGLVGLFIKPITVLQYNWMKMQDYYHEEMVSYADDAFKFPFERITFSYIPTKKNQAAALNFHLTAKEKNDISLALNTFSNTRSFRRVSQLNQPDRKDSASSKDGQVRIITQKTDLR